MRRNHAHPNAVPPPAPRSSDRVSIPLPHGIPSSTSSSTSSSASSSYHPYHKKGNYGMMQLYHQNANMIILFVVCIATILGATIVVKIHHEQLRRDHDDTTRNTMIRQQQQQQQIVVDQPSASNHTADQQQALLEQYEDHHAKIPQAKLVMNVTRRTKDGRMIHNYQLDDLIQEFHKSEEQFQYKSVARGLAGRPLSETPSLKNAKRAHIECDVNVDSLVYWNDNPSDYITTFHIPPKDHHEEYYITFNPDSGGWNNIRMSMEIIFILAAATGRTLVLPPKAPLYLLHHDASSRHRGFVDFFPIDSPSFQKQVTIISFVEFLNRTAGRFPFLHEQERADVYAASDHCDKRDASPANCRKVSDYLNRVGTVPNISAVETCIIFDEHYYITGQNDSITHEINDQIMNFCGTKRHLFYWTNQYNIEHPLLHFRASERDYRLLTHYYGMIYFTNPAINHYYKRFVRDYLHYNDDIYCAAGKIVLALQLESKQLYGTNRNEETGMGGYSAWHVRRGDLQYKKVKISAHGWYNNTKELHTNKEILYIATDERNKTFFQELYQYYEIRYLDDYWDIADLNSLDPNYMGMIDTIIASRANIFVGTFFSTFTGYINRLRGYHGITMKNSFYSWLPRKYHTHTWHIVDDYCYSYEWPDGWIGIDANVFPAKDQF